MVKIVLNEKERKLRFGLRTICATSILDDVVKFSQKAESGEESSGITEIREMGRLTAELVLAGLQKDIEFKTDYDDEENHKLMLDKVYDALDEWGEDEEHDFVKLFEQINNELMEAGFLGNVMKAMELAEKTEQNITEMPQDHKKSQK